MPRVCASVNCRELGIKGSPYSFHHFPKDPKRRLQWARNLNRKQPESGKLWMPQIHDVICAKHFTKESFTMQTRISREGGIPFLPRLEPDAVPTIFVRNKETRNTHQPASDPQLKNATSTELQNKVNVTTSAVSNSRANLYKSLFDLYKLPDVTKPRGAYIKREHQRVLSDIFASQSDVSMSTSEVAAKDVDGCNNGVTLFIAHHQSIKEAEQTDTVRSVHHSSAHGETEQVSDCDSVKTCRQTRMKMISCHEKCNGAVKAPRFPGNDAGICELPQQALKGERNPAVGREHSISSEQTLDSPLQFMVAEMDDLLEPYTIIHPSSGTTTGSADALHLHDKGSDTIMGGWHHTWSSMDSQLSADFGNDIEVKREVISDQEEDLAVSAPLEPCPTKEDMIENSSQYCRSHQRRLKRKVRSCLSSKVQENGPLLQPKCELQSPKKLTKAKSQCSNPEIQDHHTKMLQSVGIKKEPEDFDTSRVTQAGDHNFSNKSKTQISKSASDNHPFVNVLSFVSIKKEPQDFETSWNTRSVTQTTHRNFESEAETEAYPTGIYHNVHCVELRTADL